LRRAMQFVLTNPRLDAQAALDWGLLTAVHPAAQFETKVRQLARELAAAPTEALGIAKRLINQAAGVDRLDHHLDQELVQLAAIADGPNFAEGITAFFEKRPARWE
jgi:2-(1,2-epoxy-1,2-dihydrophenyl)acetyl-CoA isomerase